MFKRKNKNELKRHQKHKYRKIYLSVIAVVAAVFVIIVASPYWTGKSIDTEQTQNVVTGNSSFHLASAVYNKQSGNMLLEYYLGDSTDITSTSDDPDLSNLKFATRVVDMSHGGEDGQKLAIKSRKINNHFLVIEVSGIKNGFGDLKVDILPEKVNKRVNMQDFSKDNYIEFFVKESKVDLASGQVIKTNQNYLLDYRQYLINWNKKKIAKEQNSIKDAQATIQNDQNNLNAAKEKMEKVDASQKENYQNQISSLETDISENKSEVKQSQIAIAKYENTINDIKDGDFDS
ncbi:MULTISPECIES: hypothetical protein [Lactobacillus]|uniref:Uncharacterized protein n=1 Tax=Lactobacillus xujianguonis TaxID=2495899 RepID=A0A437SWJ7_9LACO|nr:MULTISPECIES: hypothetical protein [Lactobacillus]RVU71230.1 hypothetical protein EJK17_03265 [Lactobacillus xujianguonis]